MLASEHVIYVLLCFGEIVLLPEFVTLASVFTFLDIGGFFMSHRESGSDA